MLSWKIKNNVISALNKSGVNIINPWGFETADSSAFFSLEKGVGWRYKVVEEEYCFDDVNYKSHVVVEMKEGKWELDISDRILGNVIDRYVCAKTLQESVFMDFVMRFRFKKEYVEYADISGKKITHNTTNIYHQFQVNEVTLKCKGYDVKISVADSIVPDKFIPVIYVRDAMDEWVVHVRMVPVKSDFDVIKICTAWAGTRPLPRFISKILLKSDFIRERLWYRGERKPFKNIFIRKYMNPAAFAMVELEQGEELMWHVKMEVV